MSKPSTSIELVDSEGKKERFNHAVPSARRRIEFADIMSKHSKAGNGDLQTKLTRIVFEGELAGKERADIFKEAIESGEFSVDDIMGLGEIGVEATRSNCQMVIELFRVCVDCKKEGWLERINDDDFMLDQNFTEVHAFVNTFRDLYSEAG